MEPITEILTENVTRIKSSFGDSFKIIVGYWNISLAKSPIEKHASKDSFMKEMAEWYDPKDKDLMQAFSYVYDKVMEENIDDKKPSNIG